MKGLLIKDWKLLKNQGKFYLAVVGIALIYTLFTDSAIFGIVYPTILVSMFAVTTISYDEYNNGMSFLFTLPISRKGYALEKYIFGCITVMISLAGIVGMNCVILLFRETGTIVKEQLEMRLSAGLGGGIAVLLMLMFFIPIQLKWGAKKSQIVWIASFLAAALILGAVVKLGDILDFDFDILIHFADHISVEWLIVAAMVLLAAGFVFSCRISVGIMEKKEF